MILSSLLLTIFITFVRSQNAMMVVWGKPTSLVNPVPHFNKTQIWSECIQLCYDWKLCVVAFQNATGCNLYTYDKSPTLKKTNAADGSKVAVKAINSEKGTCPIGINYQNATGYLYDDTVSLAIKVYYNISLTGSYWKFSYFLKAMCTKDDWTHVTHEDGTSLCINIYVSKTTTPITYDQFVSNCTGAGEYPASIDYPNDARVFTTAVEEALLDIKGTKFYVRIDGKRNNFCRSFPLKEPCSTPAGYEFKNPMFKESFQYYNWVTNATVRYDMDGNCLALVYPPAKGQSMKVDVRTFESILLYIGKLSHFSCSSYGAIPALAFLCASQNTMMVVWGKPTSFSNPTPYVNGTLAWSECIQTCYNWVKCVVAFQNKTGCNLFPYDQAPVVEKTNELEGSMVAFKGKSLVNGGCPIGVNQQNTSGYLYDNTVSFGIQVYYNISLADSFWKFYFHLIPMCPSNFYTYSYHDDGTFLCVQIIYSEDTLGLNYTATIDGCNSVGGYLASINYQTDAGFLTGVIQQLKSYFLGTEFYIRIDGIRTTECRTNPSAGYCSTPYGFTFTDPLFKGSFQYYDWATSVSAKVETDDDCIVFVYPPTSGQNMKMDVRSCSALGALKSLGSLCVRKGFT